MERKTSAEMIAEAIEDDAREVAERRDEVRAARRGRPTLSDLTSEETSTETLESLERVVASLSDLAAFVRNLPHGEDRIGALITYNLARAKGFDPEETWVSGPRVYSHLRGFRFRADDLRSCDHVLTELVQKAREDFERQ